MDAYETFMKGVDEEAAWMHNASMTAYLELERMVEGVTDEEAEASARRRGDSGGFRGGVRW